jgi:hypothetical protein
VDPVALGRGCIRLLARLTRRRTAGDRLEEAVQSRGDGDPQEVALARDEAAVAVRDPTGEENDAPGPT